MDGETAVVSESGRSAGVGRMDAQLNLTDRDMALFYDTPGLTYDSGLFYDAPVPPPVFLKKRMAKVKLNLNLKTDSELYEFAMQHITAMTGNANFTTPDPSAADFLALVDGFNTALQNAIAAQQTAKEMTSLKDAARSALETGLTARGSYVDLKSGGVEPVILSSGLMVKNPPAPVGELPAPAGFLAAMGSLEGQVKLKWKKVRGAVSYIVQVSPQAMPRVWTQVVVSPTTSAVATGLTPGQTYVFRVCAVGTAGQGPWSDESAKMAP